MSFDGSMEYAADSTSLVVLRDFQVNGEVKETMVAFPRGTVILCLSDERVKVID